MRRLTTRRLFLVLGGLAVLIAAVPPPAGAVTPELTVWHKPPGLLLRGERVTLRVSVETDGSETVFEGDAQVRGDPLAEFTRIPLVNMAAEVPSELLDGSVLEDYVEGTPYSEETRFGWAPVVGDGGQPLDAEGQLRGVQPNQPLSGGLQLVVEPAEVATGHQAPTDWRVAVATAAGDLTHAWRITASNDLDLDLGATPATMGGDPVVVFGVYDFERGLMEHLVLRLSSEGGIEDRLSLGRGAHSGPAIVTNVRVGADGRLYQLHSDPGSGLKVARYALGAAPAPSSTPSSSPTLAAGSSGPATPTPPSSSMTPTAVAAAPTAAPDASAGPFSASTALAVSLGILALAAVAGAALWWRRHPGRSG